MARFNNGWVKLYRKVALGDIGSNYTRSGLFGALISMANIQSSIAEWKGRPRKLSRGEVVTSLRELAELGSCDVKTISRHLNYLSLRDTIFIEKSSSGTFIKILNFAKYQGQDAEGSTQEPHGMDDDRDDDVHAIGIHIEEGKNKRRKEVILADLQKQATPTSDNFSFSSIEEIKSKIPSSRWDLWLQLYPSQDYIDRELIKVVGWLLDNPKKNHKSLRGWNQFLAAWFARGWPQFQKQIPTQHGSLKEFIDAL